MSALPILPVGPAADTCRGPRSASTVCLTPIASPSSPRRWPSRCGIRILDVLRRSEESVCQCELIALFDLGQSLLSHHIKKLVDAGLVVVQGRHKSAYYSIPPEAFKELTAWLS